MERYPLSKFILEMKEIQPKWQSHLHDYPIRHVDTDRKYWEKVRGVPSHSLRCELCDRELQDLVPYDPVLSDRITHP